MSEILDIILSRCLPKTGAHADPVYIAGDDDTYQAGWWRGLLNATNKPRFLDKELPGNVASIIDYATKLQWAKIPDEAGCNNDVSIDFEGAITYAENLTFGGFSDWRIPNINELLSIVDYSENNPAIWAAFVCNPSYCWSSTTYIAQAEQAFYVNFSTGEHRITLKIAERKMRCVRDYN